MIILGNAAREMPYECYWLVTQNCVRLVDKKQKHVVNKATVFHIFDLDEVSKFLTTEIKENTMWYEDTFHVVLRVKGVSFDDWVKNRKLRSVPSYKVTVFVLSVFYRHQTKNLHNK